MIEATREVIYQRRPNSVVSRWELELRTAICLNCKALMWIEERMRGSSKRSNSIATFTSTPPYLRILLADLNFIINRIYNSLLSFTSKGRKIDNTVSNVRGLYFFHIRESNYHRIGCLLPQPGKQLKFAQ
ncbi:ATP-dependent helicase/deoxyribonuclease subunit B [Bienertia sinuspersici]